MLHEHIWPVSTSPTTCCIVASTLHSGGKRPHTNRHQAVGAWVRDCGGWAGAWVRLRIFKQAQPEVALRCVSTIEVLVFSHVWDQGNQRQRCIACCVARACSVTHSMLDGSIRLLFHLCQFCICMSLFVPLLNTS